MNPYIRPNEEPPVEEEAFEMTIISQKINSLTQSFQYMAQIMDLTPEKLAAFERYIAQAKVSAPMIADASGYRAMLHNGDSEKLEKRLNLMRALMAVMTAK